MTALENTSILCVDDEKDIVRAYVDFLAPTDEPPPKRSSRAANAVKAESPKNAVYTVFQAYSGEAALELVKKELAAGRHIAGGFFDVKMDGGMDGIRTMQEIWKLDPDMNTTIVTAYQDRSVEDINQIFGPRFKDQWDYMNKPFSQGEILQKARQMTAAWNRRRHLENTLCELKATQGKLIESEKMAAIGQVARGVGHEFGNMLQQIVGNADLALESTDVTKLHQAFEVILQASHRASIITRNLQSFSKKQNTREPVDLRLVIGDTLALMNHKFKQAVIQLEDQRKPVAKMLANPVELQQVLVNLIINAIHAMPEGGKLAVGCDETDGTVRMWVIDSGLGIPPDVLPKIFDYAFTTKEDKGSGLGLSISKQIVESHGGKITVQSKMGSGTVFIVDFSL